MLPWVGAFLSLSATVFSAAQSLFGEKRSTRVRLNLIALIVATCGFAASAHQLKTVEDKRADTRMRLLGRLTDIAGRGADSAAIKEDIDRLRDDLATDEGVSEDYVYVEVWRAKKEIKTMLAELNGLLVDQTNKQSLVNQITAVLQAVGETRSAAAAAHDAAELSRLAADSARVETLATHGAADGARDMAQQAKDSAGVALSATQQTRAQVSEAQKLVSALQQTVDTLKAEVAQAHAAAESAKAEAVLARKTAEAAKVAAERAASNRAVAEGPDKPRAAPTKVASKSKKTLIVQDTK